MRRLDEANAKSGKLPILRLQNSDPRDDRKLRPLMIQLRCVLCSRSVGNALADMLTGGILASQMKVV
ncbi:MAG: hypothetical protein R3C19_01065 [Planctomycetaceae bacterium]